MRIVNFPAGEHQFYATILALVIINLFLYVNDNLIFLFFFCPEVKQKKNFKVDVFQILCLNCNFTVRRHCLSRDVVRFTNQVESDFVITCHLTLHFFYGFYFRAKINNAATGSFW